MKDRKFKTWFDKNGIVLKYRIKMHITPALPN